MRITLFTTELGSYGGVQRYGAQLRDSLEQLGHEVDVLQSASWASRLRRVDGLRAVRRSCRKSDVLWIGHPRLAPFALAVVPRHLPLVASTYGFETWGRCPATWRYALGRVDLMTTLSAFTESMTLVKPRESLRLAPTWGADPAKLGRTPERDERFRVTVVTRLDEPYKGVDLVLELARRSTWTSVVFTIAGAGEHDAVTDLRRRIGHAANVELIHQPDDEALARLYRDSLVVLLPSRAERTRTARWAGGEGFGIVLLEAARAGTPVVASQDGSCPEVVALLGHGLVAPVDVESFEVALNRLLDDERLWSALSARAVAAAPAFSPDQFTRRVAIALDALTNSRPAQ